MKELVRKTFGSLVFIMALCLTFSVFGNVNAYALDTLRKGNSGDQVLYLQHTLAKCNVGFTEAEIDGSFGGKTEVALKRFQMGCKLPPSGVVDSDTWTQLSGKTDVKAYSLARDGNTRVSANFKVGEFACSDGSDFILISNNLLGVLENIRSRFSRPVKINSGYRTTAHNARLGAVPNSQHRYGTAADIVVDGVSGKDLYEYADKNIPEIVRGGLGAYYQPGHKDDPNFRSNMIHVDVRSTRARWTDGIR
ncbi:MAG: peptidoglycan-binding protein [Oscillospiraceae bacterium]|jgi:hypothetical protein|nr:peptidoglycan-binding protein [Oscillospiraceae bacterium]